MSDSKGTLTRNSTGQFIAGNKGGGRPKGSKNKITLLKLQAEEAFRGRNQDAIDAVLDQVLMAALEGDSQARKLVWDSCMSKQSMSEEKNSGTKQSITVHRMEVSKSGDKPQ